jgi:alkaline phosphatase D
VTGLEPNRPYWYRFTSGDAQSRIGRSLTLPAAHAPLERLRLGFVSCSHYEHGYFAAYRHLADENPDAVLFLGDYIYEHFDTTSTDLVRRHSDNVAAHDLRTYRNRYAQYRMDEDLQRLHATAPSLVIWDDHEVANDYGGLLSQNFDDPAEFAQRRAAAYRAYYEHMPVRLSHRFKRGALQIYDSYAFGNLAQIHLTDARQYRSAAACYGPPDRKPGRMIVPRDCPEWSATSRSMLGQRQEAWLNQSLENSSARWNVLAQSLLMAQMRRRNSAGEGIFWTDDWNGYPAARARLLRHLHEKRISNPVVLGGDIHSYWANDLKLNFDDPASPVVATEFVGTSVSAHAPTFDFAAALSENPHVRFFDKTYRGYSVLELAQTRGAVRFQAISDPRDPKAGVRTLSAFAIEPGRPGVVAA